MAGRTKRSGVGIAAKPIPDPSSEDLIPPDMDYVYFQNHKAVPFQPKADGFSLENAWWLSEASFLAYCHPGFARMAYNLAGFDEFRFFDGPGTECMVASNRRVIIVAFRGTELKSSSGFHEIATDLDTIPQDFDGIGKVHRGFAAGLDEVWDDPEDGQQGLDSYLNELEERLQRARLWVTGHSLGGALATLCLARRPEAAGAYIYGAPRVGDASFARHVEQRPFYRIVHHRDPIPLLPPQIPEIGFHFVDIGALKHITRDGMLVDEAPAFSMDEEKKRWSATWAAQTERERQLASAFNDSGYDVEKHIRVAREAFRHVRDSLGEVFGNLTEIERDWMYRIDDHMIRYYCVHLWNALVG